MKCVRWIRPVFSWLFLVFLTVLPLVYASNWSPAPAWTVNQPGLLRWVVGVTSDGRVLSLERNRNGNSFLAVYDVSNGRELKRHDLRGEYVWEGVILEDEQRVVLGERTELIWVAPVVLDLKNGTIAKTPTPIYRSIDPRSRLSASSDGRFVVAREQEGYEEGIYEFATGRFLPDSGSAIFSPDNQRWAAIETEGEAEQLVIRSVQDGAIVQSRSVKFGWGARLESWRGNQIVVFAGDQMESRPFRVEVTESGLMEPQRLPDHYGARSFKYVENLEYFHGGSWAGVGIGVVDQPTWERTWNRVVQTLRLPGNWVYELPTEGEGFRLASTWTVLDPQTGVATSRPIRMQGSMIRVSPDGRWLLTGDFELRCWQLPPRSPWPLAIGITLIPTCWLVLRRWRNRPSAIAVNPESASPKLDRP